MKSVLAYGLLASTVLAQPHGHGHQKLHKRALVTEYETQYVTVTEYVDYTTTEYITPAAATTQQAEPTPSSSEVVAAEVPQSSSSPVQSPVVETPSVAKVAAPSSKTVEAAAVVKPSSVKKAVPVYTPPPAQPTTTTTKAAPAPAATQEASSETEQSDSGSVGVDASVSSNVKALIGKKFSGGDGTFFKLGQGACRNDAGNDQKLNIVAISAQLMGTGPTVAGNPWCGRTVSVTANGRTVQGLAQDKCPECAAGSLDMSEKMFLELFDTLDVGRAEIKWTVVA